MVTGENQKGADRVKGENKMHEGETCEGKMKDYWRKSQAQKKRRRK